MLHEDAVAKCMRLICYMYMCDLVALRNLCVINLTGHLNGLDSHDLVHSTIDVFQLHINAVTGYQPT